MGYRLADVVLHGDFEVVVVTNRLERGGVQRSLAGWIII